VDFWNATVVATPVFIAAILCYHKFGGKSYRRVLSLSYSALSFSGTWPASHRTCRCSMMQSKLDFNISKPPQLLDLTCKKSAAGNLKNCNRN